MFPYLDEGMETHTLFGPLKELTSITGPVTVTSCFLIV
jgi:hypothetical protein